MSNEITKGGDSRELSKDINVITAEINAYQQIAGEAIFEIGRRLKCVRDNPEKYGFEGFRDWERWCEDELGISRRYANQFIKVVERFGESGFPGLPQSITVLNALSTFTDEQLDQEYELPDGTRKKPVDMSRRQIEELKRQLKAEQAERERLEKENEELASREPEVVVKTEYIEIRDEYTEQRAKQAEERLKQYEERFGDIRDYDDNITATHRQDMIVAVMSFSRGVREFIKRYDYMNRYKGVINNLDKESRQQYNEAVKALKEMADAFGYTEDLGDIIDAEYSEII